MPTFSARLSPKSHYPRPDTGIVSGLFLINKKISFKTKTDIQNFPEIKIGGYTHVTHQQLP
jgi:hypothetical protein